VRPKLSRVRAPEWVIGVASAAMLVVLFATPWYGYDHRVHESGWQALAILGPFALLVGVLGVAVPLLQATRRAPALPVSATAFELLFSLLLSIALVVRVLIAHPGGAIDARYGAYLGLGLAVAVLVGCYGSLRTDGIAPEDGSEEIEVVRLADLARVGSPGAEP